MHMIECQEPWFSMLRNGSKPFTGRKNSPKYSGIRQGDTVELFCGDQRFCAKVAAIQKFSSVEEYLESVTFEKALPGTKTFQEALDIYHTWSTREEVEKWGFIAIYISL